MTEAFRDGNQGIPIHYRTDGKPFKPSRLKAKSKIKKPLLYDMLFDDNCALNASSEHEMQHSMNHFYSACNSFGLTISNKENRSDVPARSP